MKKKYRLLKSEDFKAVLEAHRRAGRTEALTVFFQPNALPHARIGISVSTKVGDAVVRSRVRRQIRAMIDPAGILLRSVDVVILVHPAFLQKTFQENEKTLVSLLNRCVLPNEEKA